MPNLAFDILQEKQSETKNTESRFIPFKGKKQINLKKLNFDQVK